MVVVRAGAVTVEKIAATVVVVAVGIPSKKTSGHVVAEILTAIVATTECFVKCIDCNVYTHLIPI